MAFAGGFPGKTPRTPHPKILKTDAAKVQQAAIAGNIGAFPDIEKLGNLYSDSELAQIEKVLPGYSDSLTAGAAASSALLRQALPYIEGEIPPEVQAQIQRSSAYNALRGGYQGSPMALAGSLRDYGVGIMQGQQFGAQLAGQGANTLQAWDSLARRNMLNPASMLVTPGQAISVDQQNRINQYNALQHSYNVQAQPHPLHNIIMGLTEAYLGSLGGGGMGGMGGGGGAPAGATDTSGLPYNANQSWMSNAATPNFNYTNQYIPQYAPGNYYNPMFDTSNPWG